MIRTIHTKRLFGCGWLTKLAHEHFGSQACVPEFFDPQDVIGYIQVDDRPTAYAVVSVQAAARYQVDSGSALWRNHPERKK